MKMWSKRLLAGMICVMLIVTMSGCGEKKKAQTAFEAMMQVFLSGDAEEIKAYYDFEMLDGFAEDATKERLITAALEFLKVTEYRIDSVEKLDRNNVRIDAVVTTLDFTKVVQTYLQEVMAMAADEAYQAKVSSMSQEEYQTLLTDQMLEIIHQEQIERTEIPVSVTMAEVDGTWIPGGDKETLFGVLFGNFIEAVQSLI